MSSFHEILSQQMPIDLVLRDYIVVRAFLFSPGDEHQISQLAQRNFREAPSYRQLTPQARERYIQANSPEGVLETCCNKDNLVALVVRDLEGNIIGFRVVRRGSHKFDNTPVAEGKRLHVSIDSVGNGLGRAIMALSEVLAREDGYGRMVVNSSGDSYHFFLRLGFMVVQHTQNPVLLSEGVTANLVYMEKAL